MHYFGELNLLQPTSSANLKLR